MTAGPGIDPGTHLLKVSALTTTPSLLLLCSGLELFYWLEVLFLLYHLLFRSPITDCVWKGTVSLPYDWSL